MLVYERRERRRGAHNHAEREYPNEDSPGESDKLRKRENE